MASISFIGGVQVYRDRIDCRTDFRRGARGVPQLPLRPRPDEDREQSGRFDSQSSLRRSVQICEIIQGQKDSR